MLKKMLFKLKEQEELRKQLAIMQKMKQAEMDTNKMKELLERSAFIGMQNDDVESVKRVYLE